MSENDDFKKALKQIIRETLEEARAEEEAAKKPTKEEILAIQDRAERQKMIAKYIDLF